MATVGGDGAREAAATEPPRMEEDGGGADAEVVVTRERLELAVRLAVLQLPDRSTYAGQVDADGVPDGVGVLTTAFGSVYEGQLHLGVKDGLGVETGTNGSTYAGEFVGGNSHGYGVHTSALGDKYTGQWRDGSRHGVGLSVDADARVALAGFVMDEPEALASTEDSADESSDQHLLHVQRAFFAEASALISQESARASQLSATLQADRSVDGYPLNAPEDAERFEADAQAGLDAFVRTQDVEAAELAAAASALKLEEARLAQRQKQLRQEVAARGQELARAARFCDVAAARKAEVLEARRALAMLQHQAPETETETRAPPSPPAPTRGAPPREGPDKKGHAYNKRMARTDARLAVLSLNIFCRPTGIHSGRWFRSGDYKDLRLALLLRKMEALDVVILQEMFEVAARHRRFLRDAHAMGFRYHCGSVWPRLLDRRLIDGGLLILSRFPIVERDQLAFSRGSGSDGVCAKGVLHARLQLSPDLSDSLHVFVTHTQAGDHRPDVELRALQLRELLQFVARTVRRDDDESASTPVLLAGDLNMDARHDMEHDPGSGRLRASHKCRESRVYREFVAGLERALDTDSDPFPESGRVPGKRERRVVIDLMKLKTGRDDSDDDDNDEDDQDAGDLHPITNGDGHATLVHRDWSTDTEGGSKRDGKCIDYMFFSPGVSETPLPPVRSSAAPLLSPLAETSDDEAASSTTTIDSAATTSTTVANSAAELESPETPPVPMSPAAAPRFKLELVEAKTRVDHCRVADVVAAAAAAAAAAHQKRADADSDSDPSSRRSPRALRLRKQLPITHLSDHYGLLAEFRVVTASPVTRPDGSPAARFESLADVLQLHFPPHAFAQPPQRLWRLKLVAALLAIVSAALTVLLTVAQAVGVRMIGT